MKHVTGRNLIVALVALLAAAATLRLRSPTPDDERDAAGRERALALGQEAAGALSGALIPRLTAAIEEGGVAYAIAFCAGEAMPLTRGVDERLGAGIQVKRTSTRWRNPANAPDSLELAALAHFRAELDAGRPLPPDYLQPLPDGAYRYNRPLSIVPLCLQCHGTAGDIPAEAQARLRELYPDDRATGYRVGDFRGLIRVEVAPADR